MCWFDNVLKKLCESWFVHMLRISCPGQNDMVCQQHFVAHV